MRDDSRVTPTQFKRQGEKLAKDDYNAYYRAYLKEWRRKRALVKGDAQIQARRTALGFQEGTQGQVTQALAIMMSEKRKEKQGKKP